MWRRRRRKGRETALVMNCVEIRGFFSCLIFSLLSYDNSLVSKKSKCYYFPPPKATCFGVLRCNTLDITEVQEEEFYFFFPEEQQMFLSSSPPPNVQIKCQRILSISIKFHPSSSYLVLVDPVFNHPRNAGFTWFSFVAF